jgi:hypothetical protein
LKAGEQVKADDWKESFILAFTCLQASIILWRVYLKSVLIPLFLSLSPDTDYAINWQIGGCRYQLIGKVWDLDKVACHFLADFFKPPLTPLQISFLDE